MTTRTRIIVPQRTVSGGFDFKFETDPYDVKLYNLMSPEQYTEAIENVNAALRKARAGKVDGVLLATGVLMVPLAIWGIRHKGRTKKRKKLLKLAIQDFNTRYPDLLMRWNRRPQSCLSIELKAQAGVNPAPSEVVEARVIGDSGAADYQPPQVIQNPPFSAQQLPQQQQPDATTPMIPQSPNFLL